MGRKMIAGICIVVGIALLAVPFFYKTHGKSETDKLLKEFEQIVEEGAYEDEIKKEEPESEQASGSEEDTALLLEENVIGIIEIEAIDIRLPIVEGTSAGDIAYAIGHMSETAPIGAVGNCVLAGHNGSRNGVFFTNLNQLVAGDKVKLIDGKGEVHLYEVSDMFIVGPYDNEVKAQGEDEILTLLTCAEKGTKRYVVRCMPTKEVDENE